MLKRKERWNERTTGPPVIDVLPIVNNDNKYVPNNTTAYKCKHRKCPSHIYLIYSIEITSSLTIYFTK